MIVRSPAENKIALTLTLSPFDKAQGRRWNGRGNFSIDRARYENVSSYPRPLAGEGEGEGDLIVFRTIVNHTGDI
jgi:hypothetical protein